MTKTVFFALISVILAVLLPPATVAQETLSLSPVVAGSEGIKIVRVRDLPNVPQLQRKSGVYVDLGYKWEIGGPQGWIGYIGSDTKYVLLSRQLLDAMLKAAGLDALPKVPQEPGKNMAPLLQFIGLLGLCLLLHVSIQKMTRVMGARSAARARSVRRATRQIEPISLKSCRKRRDLHSDSVPQGPVTAQLGQSGGRQFGHREGAR